MFEADQKLELFIMGSLVEKMRIPSEEKGDWTGKCDVLLPQCLRKDTLYSADVFL